MADNPNESPWRAEPFDRADKHITLVGPNDGYYPQQIYLDFDDVNHPEIERRVPIILAALNGVVAAEWDVPAENEEAQ